MSRQPTDAFEPPLDPASLSDASHTHDLDAALHTTWALLSRGVADRRSPFHTPSVATVDAEGAPATRTVVLRAADPAQWMLRFHTDRRSGKFADLSAVPRIALLAYDVRGKIQVRATGLAKLHTDDEVAAAAWRNSRAQSRQCYTQEQAPGAELASPAEARFLGGEPDENGRANFAAVVVDVHALEWLFLRASGHRRARFERTADGAITARWLAP
ncbi:MAG: pyridoxamine 5'-phosphate oxidase family protein [Hyphomicrobiaceae bacterium]|nr:pyridoxamine 5'-phosphate oxidase family protein [Hyphomicrobiaceae bacterium]